MEIVCSTQQCDLTHYAHCSMYRYVHPRTFDSLLGMAAAAAANAAATSAAAAFTASAAASAIAATAATPAVELLGCYLVVTCLSVILRHMCSRTDVLGGSSWGRACGLTGLGAGHACLLAYIASQV